VTLEIVNPMEYSPLITESVKNHVPENGGTCVHIFSSGFVEMRSLHRIKIQQSGKRYNSVVRSPADSLISVQMPFQSNKVLGDSFVNVHNQVLLSPSIRILMPRFELD
jgi:hypothetical protein